MTRHPGNGQWNLKGEKLGWSRQRKNAECRGKKITTDLAEELERIKTNAGIIIPLKDLSPVEYWTRIENGMARDAFKNSEALIDAIENSFHGLVDTGHR